MPASPAGPAAPAVAEGSAEGIAEGIAIWARTAPEAVAILSPEGSVSFAALERAVRRAAAALARQGVAPGRPVGVATLSSAPLDVVAMLALARIGAVQVLVSPGDPAPVRAARTARMGVAAMLTAAEALAIPGLPWLRPDPAWLDGAEAAMPPPPAPVPDAAAPWVILFSSGTTGEPKAVALTHAMGLARLRREAALFGYRPGARYLGMSGLMFWVARFRALACLDAGATLVLEELPPGEAMPGRIAALGITHLSGTPGHLHALVAAAGAREGLALPGIERLRASSAMVPEALRRAVRQRLTPHLHVNYGSNEAGPIAGGGPEALDAHPDSVGPPLPGIELELVDAAGRPVPRGAVGEVRLRGAGVAEGYVGNAAATRRAFRDGWFHPGDLAVQQADGTLVLKGRADDAMNWDGVLVLPADIERALLEHPAVADAAAFPLVSARFQHVPAAAVVLRGPATAAELQGFCRRALGAKAPPVIEVLPALPRNAAGKLLRREMAASLAAKLERRGAPLG